jgi:hypothetical protein
MRRRLYMALQDLVKKIFGDEATRAQFMKNPDSVLSQYTLTAEEKRAVLSTHSSLGLVTGNSTHLEAVMDRSSTWSAPEA